MAHALPQALRDALGRELEGVSRRDLAGRAAKTSAAYRAGKGSAGVIRTADDALAYALARLPATYAACAAAFVEARRAAPAFAPRRLLDAGSGPGAASWAAAEAWPGLGEVAWLDSSAPFLALARRLASDAGAPLAASTVIEADLAAGGAWPSADLVVASYALAEIAPAALGRVVAGLWGSCDGVLALIEPGTPAGFHRILAARDALIGAGADILAPCPHARACPLTALDRPDQSFPGWCHFAVRLPRSRDHKLAKAAEAPFEDEKFVYLIAARPGVAVAERTARPPRVLAGPRLSKGGATFKLCASAGLQTRAVSRRDKAAYAVARRLGWGDPFEMRS